MQSPSDRDARIRDRAYQIWDREGRPHGHEEAHWQQATREIEAEETGPAGSKKAPARPPRMQQSPVTIEANPPAVSRAPAKDEATAKKPRARASSKA
jgi:hypothetical protein